MKKKTGDQKTLMIAAISAAAVALILVTVFVFVRSSSTHDPIILPDTPAQTEQPAEETPPEDVFAQVSPENVQSILSMLTPPQSYHQTLSLTTYSGELSREQTVDVWHSGALLLVQTADAFGTRTCLTDGQTLYVWYTDADTVETIVLDGTIDAGELSGVPDYEMLLSLSPSQILQADYVTLTDLDNLQCVFAGYTENGLKRYYWVSLDSGLLCKQTTLKNETPVYTLQQTAYEVYMGADEALNDVFVFPDGTQPFASAAGKSS